MSVYYLDTDTVSLLQRGNNNILHHMMEHDASEVRITVITVREQIDGQLQMVEKARSPQAIATAYQQLQDTFTALRDLPIAGFNIAAIVRFDALLKMKLNVGKNDLRIAAIALEAGGIVVTRNHRDFARVPELVITDWSTGQ